MYFISILAIILVVVIVGYFGGFSPTIPASFTPFLDMPSLLLLLLICIPILIASGLLKDFNNAFRIALGRKNSSLIEIKRAIEAVSLMFKTLIYGGFFLFLASIVTELSHLDMPELLGSHVAAALLCLIYGIIIAILLLPIKSILEVRMIEFMTDHKEEETEHP